MVSKRAEKRRRFVRRRAMRMCGERPRCEASGKVRFADRGAALVALEGLRMEADPGDRLKVYRCPHCQGWHAGNSWE